MVRVDERLMQNRYPRRLAVEQPEVEPKPVPAAGRWSFEWTYFVFVFAMWCFVPLLRRLLDYHNGFYNPIQPISTVPFVSTIPIAFFAFRPDRIARLSPTFRLFAWVWVGSFAYGLLVALFAGNGSAGAYEAVQYLIPMLVGIWLAGQDIDNLKLMQRLTRIILIFGGVVAVYGVAQFAHPMPWDVLWVEGGKFASIGPANPFQIRLFSTLNSPGPAADFFSMSIILALPFFELKRLWIWPFVGALGGALLLTLVRESWIGLVVGLLVYLFASPRRFRAIPFIAVYVVLIAFFVASLPALLGAGGDSDVVTTRLNSLSDVDHDASAITRSQEIQESLQQGLANPVGLGLGEFGASSALSSNPENTRGNNLDSGYMARLLELGWLGFAGYLFVVVGGLVTILISAFRMVGLRHKSRETLVMLATAASICAALAWSDAAGDSHLGLDALFFWIAMGIGFRPATAREPARPELRVIATRAALRRSAGAGGGR